MIARQYPREAWVLMPSFKPKKVTVIKVYKSWDRPGEWDVAESGKLYHHTVLFETVEQAVADGREQVAKQQADLTKRQVALNKRISELEKASAAMSAGDAKGASDE